MARQPINVNGYFVYIHMTLEKEIFYVGVGYAGESYNCNGNAYEYRRYTNRPKYWKDAVANSDNQFLAYIAFDNIKHERIAKSIATAIVFYLEFFGKTEKLIQMSGVTNEKVSTFLENNNNINMREYIKHFYKDKYKTVKDTIIRVDTNKRNYHRNLISKGKYDT